jgi:predicted phosphodiesterase
MRILIIGDVHGRHRELAERLRQVQTSYRIAAGIQVGDYGFSRADFARDAEEQLRYPVPLHVIDGNHEDHEWLRRALRRNTPARWQETMNLVYQPRPSVARLGSSKVGFLGGALHVDRPQRHNLLAGLPNYILRRQREQAAALFNRERPGLLVTHSCPAGIGIGMRGSPDLALGVAEHIHAAGFDAGPAGDCGEQELRQLWDSLDYRPRGWVFGHFHAAHNTRIGPTRFLCVHDDPGSPAPPPLVLWDTEEQELLTCQMA